MNNDNEIISEEWRPVNGYEGLYEISNIGRVKSVSRNILYQNGSIRHNPGRVLRLVSHSKNHGCTYYSVLLSKNNIQRRFFVHRLVAETFIIPEHGKTFVNHKDGNKHNNVVSNLEWVTHRENCIHAVYSGLSVPHYGIKPVICTTTGKRYESVSEAANKLGLQDSAISKVCKQEYKNTKGYRFEYAL